MTGPLFTIGHSTRTIDEFTDMLRAAGIRRLVDVRSIPKSLRNPQYHVDRLGDALGAYQIAYARNDALGGRRPKSKTVAADVNGWWTNQSFHNYADYALGEPFAEGLDLLLAESAGQPTAIMCAEAVWWRCHRRIVADYALHRGRAVVHLMAPGRNSEARMTPAAIAAGSALHYPAGEPSGE